MNYKDMLQTISAEDALFGLDIVFVKQGAYLKFDCPEPECKGTAVIKSYGDKKNLYYCPTCKSSGHIISLTMKTKGVDWKEANEWLLKEAVINSAKKITQELNMKYELLYSPFIASKGISEETCQMMEIGIPKGKTMLAGCVAFAVRDDEGKKIAYYGIKVKDGKANFHKSFNPELYLYGFGNIDKEQVVYFTTDMLNCVKMIEDGKQCICNFGLPYLSPAQLDLIQNIEHIVFVVDEPSVRDFAIQLASSQKMFYRFE